MNNGTNMRLTVRSDPRHLCAIRALVRGYLSDMGVDADRIDDAVLAVDEACANAIRHSYEGATDHEFELTFAANGEYVDIALQDEGIPAPRNRIERRELKTPDTSELKPGGLGVQLIYSAFDDVQFEPGDNRGNTVVMRMKRPPA